MTGFFDVEVLGVRTRIELPDALDASQRDRVKAAWSGALSPRDGTPELEVPLSQTAAFDVAMERLTVDVTLTALAELRGRALMFHAAGIADERGRVAAFVGPSGRGKTTISRTLGRRYAYVSDETVAVDAALAVSPYRKPLSIVREGAPKEQLSPKDAGLEDLPDADLRLHTLVLLDRDESLASAEITEVPLVDAIPELVPQMSYLKEQDRPLQTIAHLCGQVGGVRMLRYPDASTVPAVMQELFDAPDPNSEWEVAPIPASTDPYDADGVLDAIMTDDRIIVMVDSQVQVLDGIAPAIWLAAASGCDFAGIVVAVVELHGDPPGADARELVTAALGDLSDAGILRRR